MNFTDKVVWITGASSGIGEALAYAFSSKGAKLVLSARRKEELERVKKNCQTEALVLPMDLTQTGSLSDAAQTVIENMGRIDILVNNGGMSTRAWAHETPMSVDRRIMEVNYFGQIALTKAVLPTMFKQKGGHIAIISSLTGKFGFPLRSAYAASKHALHGYFETLGLELHKEGIGVTLVNPGRINTPISMSALTKDGTPHGEMDPGQEKGLSAEKCAKQIIRAIARKKWEVNIGKADKLMVYFKRYVPALFRFIALRVDPK